MQKAGRDRNEKVTGKLHRHLLDRAPGQGRRGRPL